MKYVKLGKTGLKCAAVSFGGIPIQRVTAEEAKALLELVGAPFER